MRRGLRRCAYTLCMEDFYFGMGQFDPYHSLFRFVPAWHEVKNKKAVTRRHDKTEVAATPNFRTRYVTALSQGAFH